MLLTDREETKQLRVQSQAFQLLEFSPVLENWSNIYIGPTEFLPYRNTVSTLDASGTAQQNTIELVIVSDAVYTGQWHAKGGVGDFGARAPAP